MHYNEVLFKLEQQRLEKVRQDIQLRSFLKTQHPSLRLRTARVLHSLAVRLYPEVETQQAVHRY
jgi:hypothetical protein